MIETVADLIVALNEYDIESKIAIYNHGNYEKIDSVYIEDFLD